MKGVTSLSLDDTSVDVRQYFRMDSPSMEA